VKFDSHVVRVLTAAVELVNGLTPGHARGTPYPMPTGADRLRTTAEAVGDNAVTAAQTERLAEVAGRMRVIFESAHEGDTDRAAKEVNRLLLDTQARPQLDLTDQGWNLHFHGADDSLANGWAAGCASGLALALGSDLAGRLGVCAAPACDRVFVDVSRNAQRRFCSSQCQSRVKSAAHRARRATS
jgi:predicted RNA-binding Zn ribbon-like protein